MCARTLDTLGEPFAERRAELVPRIRRACALMPETEFQALIDDMMRLEATPCAERCS